VRLGLVGRLFCGGRVVRGDYPDGDLDRAESTMMPPVISHFPLARAFLCIACDAVFEIEPTRLGGVKPCPACSDAHVIPLARYLMQRRQRRGAA
jgi:hypothetical protein